MYICNDKKGLEKDDDESLLIIINFVNVIE